MLNINSKSANISLESPEEHITVLLEQMAPHIFTFNFPLEKTNFQRHGDDLSMELHDGASITIINFFNIYSENASPEFIFLQDQPISSRAILKNYSIDFSMSPSSTDVTSQSSGLNSYRTGLETYENDTGKLIDGIRLSSALGPEARWGGSPAHAPLLPLTTNILNLHNHAEAEAPWNPYIVYTTEHALEQLSQLSSTFSSQHSYKNITITGSYGTLTLDEHGTWVYTCTSDISWMKQGNRYTDTFSIIIVHVDGTETKEEFAIVIAGENDPPTFNTIFDSISTNENTLMGSAIYQSTAAQQLTGTDPEGDTCYFKLAPGSGHGEFGYFTVNLDGTWTYTRTEDISWMAAGQTYEETFIVIIYDEHGAENAKEYTLVISGDNSSPLLYGVTIDIDDLSLVEGQVLSGTLSANCVDLGASITSFAEGLAQVNIDGTPVSLDTFGVFSIDNNGKWSFAPSTQAQRDAILALPEGSRVTITIPITVTDSDNDFTTKEIVINIIGSNQAPVFVSSTLSVSTSEYDILTNAAQSQAGASGTIQATDPDTGDILTFSLSGNGVGKYGNLTLAADGNWSYTPTQDISWMGSGRPYTETFTVVVTDKYGASTEQTFTLDIAGSATAPIIYNTTITASSSDIAINGQIIATCPDENQPGPTGYGMDGAATAMLNGAAVDLSLYGTVSVDPNTGKISFTAGTSSQQSALAGLGAGEVLTITIPVYAKNNALTSATENITIVINGDNLPPYFDAASLEVNTHEDTLMQGHLTGTVTATDANTSDILSYTLLGNGHGLYGILSMNSDGSWTYSRTRDISWMNGGSTYTETFIVQVNDGHGGMDQQNLTINIAGNATLPDFTAGTAEGISEMLACGAAISGTLNATSIDEGSSITGYQSGAPATATLNGNIVNLSDYGVVTINADGTWSLTAETAEQQANLLALGPNDKLVIFIPVQAQSSNGTSSESTLTVTVDGRPAPTPDTTGLYEDNVITATHNIPTTYYGLNATAFSILQNNTYITLAVDSNGNCTYAYTPAGLAYFSALAFGTPVLFQYQVSVTLSNGAVLQRTVDLNVTPTNAYDDNLHITTSSVSSGLGLATHNPNDTLQVADNNPNNFYLDRSDGLYQGNDTVLIDSGVNGINVYTYAGDDQITASGSLINCLLDMGSGNNTLSIAGQATGCTFKATDGNNQITTKILQSSTLTLGNGNNTAQTGNLGSSSITAGNGANSITTGNLNNSQITAGSGANTITAGSLSGSSTGSTITVGNNSSNSITTGSLQASNANNAIYAGAGAVTVNSTYTTSGVGVALYASSGRSNTIQASSSGGQLGGTTTLNVNNSTGSATGMYATSGTNTINSSTVAINSTSSGTSMGLGSLTTSGSTTGGQNNITGQNIGITSKGLTSYGLNALSTGTESTTPSNSITAGSSLNISGTATENAYGIYAYGASNTITGTAATTIALAADTSAGTATALSAILNNSIGTSKSAQNSITGLSFTANIGSIITSASPMPGLVAGAYSSTGLLANGDANTKNIINTTADTSITSVGAYSAWGLYSVSNASNIINAAGNATINAGVTGNGAAYSIYSSAADSISTTAGNINLGAYSQGTGAAYNVYTTNTSQLNLAAKNDLNMAATSQSGSSYNISASKLPNAITAGNNINMTSTVLSASGTACNIDLTTGATITNVTADKDISMAATAASGSVYNMYLNGSTANITSTTTTISLTSTAATGNTASTHNIYLIGASTTNLKSAGAMNLSATADKGIAFNAEVGPGSTLNLNAGGLLSINSSSNAGNIVNLYATGANASITTSSTSLYLGSTITGGSKAYNVNMSGGTTTLATSSGDIQMVCTATSTSTGTAFNTTLAGNATLNMNSFGQIIMQATANKDSAVNLYSTNVATINGTCTNMNLQAISNTGMAYNILGTSLKGGINASNDITIYASTQSNTLYNMYMGGTGTYSLTSAGNTSLTAIAQVSGTANNLNILSSSVVCNLTASNLSMQASTNRGNVYNILSSGGTSSLISKDSSTGNYGLTLKATTATNGAAVNINSSLASNNTQLTSANGISLAATVSAGTGTAYNINTSGGTTGLTAVGAIRMTTNANGTGNAYNIQTASTVVTSITGSSDSLTMDAKAASGNTCNIYTLTNATISLSSNTMSLTSTGGPGSAVLAYNMHTSGGSNTINAAQTATLTATGATSYNMFASGGSNTLNALQSATLTATGTTSYGMYASGGNNTINAGYTGAAAKVFINAWNSTGTAYGANNYAMYATGTGSNAITTGAGNDSIKLTGNISGNNTINSGAGDDTIILNGAVSGLVIDAGAGNDWLYLVAPDAATFTTNYQTWLTGLLASSSHNLESIMVVGSFGTPAWLTDLINTYNTNYPGAPITLGSSAITPFSAMLLDSLDIPAAANFLELQDLSPTQQSNIPGPMDQTEHPDAGNVLVVDNSQPAPEALPLPGPASEDSQSLATDSPGTIMETQPILQGPGIDVPEPVTPEFPASATEQTANNTESVLQPDTHPETQPENPTGPGAWQENADSAPEPNMTPAVVELDTPASQVPEGHWPVTMDLQDLQGIQHDNLPVTDDLEVYTLVIQTTNAPDAEPCLNLYPGLQANLDNLLQSTDSLDLLFVDATLPKDLGADLVLLQGTADYLVQNEQTELIWENTLSYHIDIPLHSSEEEELLVLTSYI